MKARWYLCALLPLAVFAFACRDGSTTGPSGDAGSVPNVAGVYRYESDATTMNCSNGTTVPLPGVTDTLTLTQTGNRIDGELSIASTIPAPADASFFDNCLLSPDSTYSCSGEYRDANAVIVFNGGGRFTSTGFTGSTSLRMTLIDGTVCTWTKQERGTKTG